MNAPTTPEEDGFFVFAPFGKSTEDIQVSQPQIWGTPWMQPSLFYFLTHPVERSDEISLRLSSEIPVALSPYPGSSSKATMERLHLDRYATDLAVGTGRRPFGEVNTGSDPPDFVVQTASGSKAIDCIQFAIQERRAVIGLFQALRRAILMIDPSEFSHLAGLLVYLWVYDDQADRLTLPHKNTDQTAIGALLEGLKACRFDPSLNRVPPQGPLPNQIAVKTEQTLYGCGYYLTPLTRAFPLSSFFCRTGFEIGFIYPTAHTRTSGWNELERSVMKHDKPSIEELLITIGGPDSDGLVHPSEEVLFEFLMGGSGPPGIKAHHLRRVVGHSWHTGRVVELFPDIREVSPGIFQGLHPASLQLRIIPPWRDWSAKVAVSP